MPDEITYSLLVRVNNIHVVTPGRYNVQFSLVGRTSERESAGVTVQKAANDQFGEATESQTADMEVGQEQPCVASSNTSLNLPPLAAMDTSKIMFTMPPGEYSTICYVLPSMHTVHQGSQPGLPFR